MHDWNTKQRHDELTAWQKASINQILGSAKPIVKAGAFWRGIENAVAIVGLCGIGLVCVWLMAAAVGFYWEMASSGFAWGRGALAWLMEMPR